MQIDSAIDIVTRDILLAEHGLRAEQLPALRERLEWLISQRWNLVRQSIEAGTPPRNAPVEQRLSNASSLIPMSPDHWLDSHGIRHEQNCEVNPDI